MLTVETYMLSTASRAQFEPGRVWEALAECRVGDVLAVAKLDCLTRSLRDATDIADELTKKGVALNLGGAIYDPTDPIGRLLFSVLGMVAEFEAKLIRTCTRQGMAIAKAPGKLRGRKLKRTCRRRTIWSSCTEPKPTQRASAPNTLASLDRPCPGLFSAQTNK